MIMAFPCGDRGGIAVVGRDAVLGPVSGEPFLEPCRAACFPSVAVSAPRLAPRSTTRLDEIDFALPDTISTTSASATQIHRFPNFTVLHRFSGYAERWKARSRRLPHPIRRHFRHPWYPPLRGWVHPGQGPVPDLYPRPWVHCYC